MSPAPGPAPEAREVDPFDLPDWLGVDDVTWSAESGVRSGHRVLGRLSGPEDGPGRGEVLPCDLLAVDEAFPTAVAPDEVRLPAHQAWHHGQVHLVEIGERLTLAVPGYAFTADLVLEAVGRLALAVGASPERYAVQLRIGAAGSR